MANVYINKKKIVIVSINDNQTAKDIAAQLKTDGFKNVVVLSAPKSYPGYYNVADAAADYTLFVEESASCKVQPCRVEGYARDRLGHIVSRDLAESQRAKACFRHHLKMLELEPYLLGTQEIPFDEVRAIPWYYLDKSPLLYFKTPRVQGVAQAVSAAIRDYFKQ